MAGLLGTLDGVADVDAEVDDRALVAAMLDVEAALSRALAQAGIAPSAVADAVTATAKSLDVDPDDLGRRSLGAGNPVVPLVRDLVAVVPEPAKPWVHHGATSQDVLDSALMLTAHRALGPLLGHLASAADAAALLARDHRDTLMVARTVGQPALPTTFGVKAAGWLAGLNAARRQLASLRDTALAVQLGGAAGTLAAYGSDGLTVARLLAEELGLVDPGVPWHTERSRIHALGAALGSATAACGKVATDVLLMAQAEVGEVAEGSPGGSSAMPHKRNPVGSTLAVAAARRTPGLVATLLGAGLHENERATGSWHAEWEPLRELLRLAGGSAARVASVLDDLQVDATAMRRNLEDAGPALLSEAVAGRLMPALGRLGAQDAVRVALDSATEQRRLLRDVLLEQRVIAETLGREGIDEALSPRGYLGAADVIVDRVLTADGPEGGGR